MTARSFIEIELTSVTTVHGSSGHGSTLRSRGEISEVGPRPGSPPSFPLPGFSVVVSPHKARGGQ